MTSTPGDVELDVVDPASERARVVRRAYLTDIRTALGQGLVGVDGQAAAVDLDLAPPGGAFWVAARGGVDVGCVGGRALDAATVEVKRLYVAPTARGSGLGRRLLAHVEAWARARGAQRVVLDTARGLVAASALYRASGYAEVAPYNANPHAELWFGKRVAGGQ